MWTLSRIVEISWTRDKGSKIPSSKEVEIPFLRVLMETKLEEGWWFQAIYDQLIFIDEKKLDDVCHGWLYQRRMKKTFDKKVCP